MNKWTQEELISLSLSEETLKKMNTFTKSTLSGSIYLSTNLFKDYTRRAITITIVWKGQLTNSRETTLQPGMKGTKKERQQLNMNSSIAPMTTSKQSFSEMFLKSLSRISQSSWKIFLMSKIRRAMTPKLIKQGLILALWKAKKNIGDVK